MTFKLISLSKKCDCEYDFDGKMSPVFASHRRLIRSRLLSRLAYLEPSPPMKKKKPKKSSASKSPQKVSPAKSPPPCSVVTDPSSSTLQVASDAQNSLSAVAVAQQSPEETDLTSSTFESPAGMTVIAGVSAYPSLHTLLLDLTSLPVEESLEPDATSGLLSQNDAPIKAVESPLTAINLIIVDAKADTLCSQNPKETSVPEDSINVIPLDNVTTHVLANGDFHKTDTSPEDSVKAGAHVPAIPSEQRATNEAKVPSPVNDLCWG